jgi:NADPH-dependent ferric siderophore reductase
MTGMARLLGEVGSLYRADSKYHFFFGDETSLTIFSSLTHEIHANNQEYFGVLELPDACTALPEQAGLMLDIVPPSDTPAANAIYYIDTLHERVWHVWRTAVFYLTGDTPAVQAFHRALLERGVAEKNIIVQSYWSWDADGLYARTTR